MDGGKIKEGILAAQSLIAVLKEISDAEAEVLLTVITDNLLDAILDPLDAQKYPSLPEFLLANRKRWKIIGMLREGLPEKYSFRGVSRSGIPGYVSSTRVQWFEDGVMFLEGRERGVGQVALYQNGEVKYAIYTRDMRPGETAYPQDFEFVSIDRLIDFNSRKPVKNLDEPIARLEALLNNKSNDESKYQEILKEHSWVLGLQYASIGRHIALDDKRIPDFMGNRIQDGLRDIFEVKPPFMGLFNKKGEFSANFNSAWSQAEHYLDFVKTEKSYLKGKGFNFDNPICYLIIGYDLTPAEEEKIRVKERLNPYIRVMTYNNLLAYMRRTVKFIRDMSADTQ